MQQQQQQQQQQYQPVAQAFGVSCGIVSAAAATCIGWTGTGATVLYAAVVVCCGV
jgi:hypothetical protein